MDTSVAGRVAEEIVFGQENVQTGATSDFKQMVKLARDYVLRYGMSDKVSFLGYIPLLIYGSWATTISRMTTCTFSHRNNAP